MRYLFPFRLVPQGSRIILFGTGDVGKDFYLQIYELGSYYELLAWTATSLDGYKLNKPFDFARNIPHYDYDYIVIAASKKETIDEILSYLSELGVPISKIVYSFEVGISPFPTNRRRMLSDLDFYLDIYNERRQMSPTFNGYQSFLELGIPGARSTEERIALYHVRDLLKSGDDVLDIGCNCGYLSLQISPYVRSVTGYDVEGHCINIANKTKAFLNITNAVFRCEDVFSDDSREMGTYNGVFALAIHFWVLSTGVSAESFAKRLFDLLRPNGVLFIESHILTHGHENVGFPQICAMLENWGMETVLRGQYKHLGDSEREYRVLKKL